MARSFAFDAVLFDLDGTLVATDLFWPDAAREGALRAFAELGLERPIPSPAQWMELVGQPLEEGFAALFPDMEPATRDAVMNACVEEEHRLISGGRAGVLPGVREALTDLSSRGVKLGIASNCSQDYLDAMLTGLGIGAWVDEPRCLDTPGIRNKAGMVEDLMLTFGSRRVVMVGDRAADRDAAWANGVPHVHLARGYAPRGESVEAEATIQGMDELIPLLERRSAWLDELAASLEGAVTIAGDPGAGKTMLAEDLIRRGVDARVGGEGALLDLHAPEAVLRRRLAGRDLVSGGAAAREEVYRRLEAARERPPVPGARRIDVSNLLRP